MPTDRVEEWARFSQHMEQYVREKTLGKYSVENSGDASKVDLMAITGEQRHRICVWNILKYALRCWNGCGKEEDLEKMAHYASMAWGFSETKNPEIR